MSYLTVDGLSVTYPGRPPVAALRGVDLQVEQGTTLVVLGPSGCGKTTLLRALAGFERPAAGHISLGGRVVTGPGTFVAPERRRVGIVPQEGALFPHLDVAGNIAFGLRRLGRSSRRARVAELVELVGLAGHEHRRPRELSGGQQQRVALARALAPEPSVVLLDEPFSALDAALRASVRAEVAAVLRATGSTTVLVTHERAEALETADQVVVMRDGAVAQAGPPRLLYREPLDRATAELLGDANVLPACGDGTAVRCVLGALQPMVPASGAVEILVRPEQIVLVTDDPSPHHTVEATVTEVRFNGHDALVGLIVGDHVLQARQTSATLPAPGDALRVRVAGAVWPLPVEDGDGRSP